MIELRPADVSAADRLDWWRDLAADHLVPTWITSDQTTDFHGWAKLLELGKTQVAILEFGVLRSARTPGLIRYSDPEMWELALVHGGSMRLEQQGTSTGVAPGDMVLYDTSHPFDSYIQTPAGPAGLVVLHLPKRRMAVPVMRPALSGQSFSGLFHAACCRFRYSAWTSYGVL